MLKPSFVFPVAAAQPHTWSIGGKNGTLVTVDLDTGETTFGEHYTPDEALARSQTTRQAPTRYMRPQLRPFASGGGTTYRLVFHENCNYGMKRNLLGLRSTTFGSQRAARRWQR
jgi:hypothetical protein